MAKTDNLTDFLTDLADGIRKVEGTTEDIDPQHFRDRVESLVATVTHDASADDSEILSGKTAWVNGEKVTGTMANKGAVSQTLNAGGSFTIPAGYHNGSGKVTANSLASQTSATAVAGDILSGKTAYVNGSKITGTIASKDADDLSVNGKTVYVSPGYYPSEVSKAIGDGSCSVSGGELTAGAGNVSATGTYITLTEVSGPPASGAYIEVTGSGTVGRTAITKSESAGFISGGTSTISSSTSRTSNTATRYYVVDTGQTYLQAGVYVFRDIPIADPLSYGESLELSQTNAWFGWTDTSSGDPGTSLDYTYTSLQVDYSIHGLTIWYGSTVAYSTNTQIVSKSGWQAVDTISTLSCRTIIVPNPVPIDYTSDFYYWWGNNLEREDDWTGGSGGGDGVETGELYFPSGIPDQLYIPVFKNGTATYEAYSAQSGGITVSDVMVGVPFTLCPDGASSGTYLYIDQETGVTRLQLNSADELYIGYLNTSSGGRLGAYLDCCFDGTSRVFMADGTTKALADISAGDMVMTYNEITGAAEANEVTGLGTVTLRAIKVLVLADGTEIRMNAYHPMWTEDGWKSITQHKGLPLLTEEDRLLNNNGEYVNIKEIRSETIEKETYYTIKVANNNNFYVNGYLAQGKDKD